MQIKLNKNADNLVEKLKIFSPKTNGSINTSKFLLLIPLTPPVELGVPESELGSVSRMDEEQRDPPRND